MLVRRKISIRTTTLLPDYCPNDKLHICIGEVKKHNITPLAAKAQLFLALYKANHLNKYMLFPLGKSLFLNKALVHTQPSIYCCTIGMFSKIISKHLKAIDHNGPTLTV